MIRRTIVTIATRIQKSFTLVNFTTFQRVERIHFYDNGSVEFLHWYNLDVKFNRQHFIRANLSLKYLKYIFLLSDLHSGCIAFVHGKKPARIDYRIPHNFDMVNVSMQSPMSGHRICIMFYFYNREINIYSVPDTSLVRIGI